MHHPGRLFQLHQGALLEEGRQIEGLVLLVDRLSNFSRARKHVFCFSQIQCSIYDWANDGCELKLFETNFNIIRFLIDLSGCDCIILDPLSFYQLISRIDQ